VRGLRLRGRHAAAAVPERTRVERETVGCLEVAEALGHAVPAQAVMEELGFVMGALVVLVAPRLN